MNLTRDLIRQIASDEALSAGVTFHDLIGMASYARPARVRAWARIIQLTNCKPSELADAWGCSREAVYAAFPRRTWADPNAASTPYDSRTIGALSWLHGPERTGDILAGLDEATNADIAAWKRLCTRAQGRAA